jgi:MFS family permease
VTALPSTDRPEPSLAPARPAAAIALATTMQAIGGGLGWSAMPPLMPEIGEELGVSHAMHGLVWGAASLGIALASPFGGAAVDRFGPRRVAAAGMLVGAAACALRVTAVGPWSLAAIMLLFGMHIAFVAPSIPKALASHVAPARLARANGAALLGYTLGTALTVLVARTWLAPALGGWRHVMLFAAAMMVVAALLWGALLRDRGATAPHAHLSEGFSLLRIGELRRVAAMHFLLFGGYLALLGLLPRALMAFGLEPTEVGLAVAGWLACAGFANFAGPILAERVGRSTVILAGSLVAGTALALLAVLPTHPAWLLGVAAMGGGAFAPLLMTYPLEIEGIGLAKAGAAIGLLTLVGQLGGFLLPVVSSTLVGEGAHFDRALAFLAVAHLAIALPALLSARRAAPAPAIAS